MIPDAQCGPEPPAPLCPPPRPPHDLKQGGHGGQVCQPHVSPSVLHTDRSPICIILVPLTFDDDAM